MITYFDATLAQLSIHYSRNKLLDESYRFSQNPLPLADETISKLLMQYFLTPFKKVNETHRLSHPSGNLNLNELYHFSSSIFEKPESFHENSVQITKHLFDVSKHPKIKSGELYLTYFDDL